MKYNFYGEIKDGKLVFDNPRLVKEALACLKDMRVEVVIRKEGNDPSLDQWRYLYACVYTPFAEFFGWTIDEVDVWMKKSFMKDNGIVLPDGLMLTKTVFNREWLAKYIDSCIQFAAEEGIVVMPPSTAWKKFLKKGQ